MEVRTERDDDERHLLVDRRGGEVTLAQIDLDASERGAPGAHVQHAARRVDSDHANALGCDRNRDAAGTDAELDDRTAAALRLREVERHVFGHRRAPRVVELGNRVVRAKHRRYGSSMLETRAAFVFTPPRLVAGEG